MERAEMEPKEIVKIKKATVKRKVVSREGLDSNGSDVWLHQDILEKNLEEVNKRLGDQENKTHTSRGDQKLP